MKLKQRIGEPPDDLEPREFIVQVKASRGAQFDVIVPPSSLDRLEEILEWPPQGPKHNGELLLNMGPNLRNKYFVKRGGFALATVEPLGRVSGEINNVVSNQRQWEKMPYWPPEFVTQKEEYKMDLPPEDDYESEYEDEAEPEGSFK